MGHIDLLLISLTIGVVNCYSNGYSFENQKYCDDLSPYYGDINLDQITGVWYGVEKIPHTREGYRDYHYRSDRTRECFYIDIKELDVQPTTPAPYGYDMSYIELNNPNSYLLTTSPYVNPTFGFPERHRVRKFVLEWHEGLGQDDYHIKVNTSHKGFWTTDVPSHAVDQMYRHFGGVIQVLKVANNHLVLNFCMRLPHAQFFSVVLARTENQLTYQDLDHIHNVFTIKHLSTTALQKVCDNSATASGPSLFLIGVFLLVWKSRAQ